MKHFNRKVEDASARVNKSVADATERIEKETAEFITAFREAQGRAAAYGREISFSAARLGTLTNHFCGMSQDNFCLSADGNVSTPLEELLGLLENAQILGKGARGPNPTGMSVLTFGVQVVEVAVDVETGEVCVERVGAVHDVGRIINPLGARSQMEGGIIQGIGHTLSEQRLIDPETGRILTTTLDAYRMPTIADIPKVVCEFVDKPDEHLTSLGAKGLGEPPIVPLAAAVANAIRDATGADVHELPISREEMLRALREAATKERRGTPAAV